MSFPEEPEITINGRRLTRAEAMTVRVALGAFALDISPASALGDDETGEAIRVGYRKNLASIQRKINLKEPGK